MQHGLSPSFVIFDEVWAQPNRHLWDALSLATGAWPQPLIIAITTAGYDRESLAHVLYEHGRDGDDDTFFFRWFTAPDELAFDDPPRGVRPTRRSVTSSTNPTSSQPSAPRPSPSSHGSGSTAGPRRRWPGYRPVRARQWPTRT